MSEPIEEPVVDPEIGLEEEETYEIVEDPTPVEEAVAEGADIDQALELLDFTGGLGPRIASASNPEEVESESQIEDVEEDNVASETTPFQESEPLDWEVAIENANAAMRVELDEIQKSVDYSLENNSMYEVISEAQNRAIEMGEEILQAHDLASQATTDAQDAHNAAVAAATAASEAKTTADNAATAAEDALDAAATAAGIAEGKANVLIQATAPDTSFQNDKTLWIDTTGGANTPKRWNGTAWQAVTDKAAIDAANAAAAAQSAANAAQNAANAAQSDATQALQDAANAQDAAGQADAKAIAALTSANSKNTIIRALGLPTSTNPETGASFKEGDLWWRWDNDVNRNVIGQWAWRDGAWKPESIAHQVISSMDVNKLVVTGSALMSQAVAEKILVQGSGSVIAYIDGSFTDDTLRTIRTTNSGWSWDSELKQLQGSSTFWLTDTAQDTGTNSKLLVGQAYRVRVTGDGLVAGEWTLAQKSSGGYVLTSPTYGSGYVETIVKPTHNETRISLHKLGTAAATISKVEIIGLTGTTLIEPGSITTSLLRADAIDGMTMTAGIFRTHNGSDPTRGGIEIDTNGFRAYRTASPNRELMVNINSTSGTITGMTITGGLIQTTAETNRGIKLTSGGLIAYNSAGNVTATINAAGGAFTGYTISGGTITGATIQTEAASNRGVKITTANQFKAYDSAGVLRTLIEDGWFVTDQVTTDWITNKQTNMLQLTGQDITGGSGAMTEITISASGIDVRKMGLDPATAAPVQTAYFWLREPAIYMNDQRNTAFCSVTFPESKWQAATPLIPDGSGRLFRWANAPQRPVMASGSLASGTTIAAGNYRDITVSFSVSETPRMIVPDISNFPGGSANLSVRVASWTSTSAVIRIVNSGAASTLGGALGVRVALLI